MRRVTIYSVAGACGVSASTVSRAFTRPDLVKESVRELILEKAAELGYQPNRSARATATGRTAMVGLVVPDITNPFVPPLVRAVQRAAEKVDYSVLLVDAEGSRAAEARSIAQLQGEVDGLVLASPRASSDALHAAIDELPCVVINRVVRGLPSANCDNGAALTSIANELRTLGHRSAALLKGPASSWASRQRIRAVRTWAAATGENLVELGPFDASFEGGRDAGAELLKTEATAAFAFDDVMACGVLSELAANGVDVPADRSVVGCDDVLLARMVTPTLTTVTAPMTELGQAAISLLNEQIGQPGREPRRISLDGTAVLRDSIGPA